MQTNWQIAILLLGLVVVTAQAGEGSLVTVLFDAMREGKYREQYDSYAFPKLTTNDIAELIVYASRTNLLTSFPVNAWSSIGKLSCTEGMVALWLIEGIRIGGDFPSLVPACYDRSKTISSGAMFYAEADQHAIVKAYSSWWAKTKGQLKEVAPLDDSSLTWFGGRNPAEEKK